MRLIRRKTMKIHRPTNRKACTMPFHRLITTALLMGLSTSAVLAQDTKTATESTYTLKEFQVTGVLLYNNQVNALRTPTPILDVPQSLSITTSTEIQERGITSIGQIVDYTPGVTTSQGEGHRDAVVFRGVRSTADFFIDGFRDDVQYYRPLYNVEQVEVLRGPSALFFGRGGTGGVFNRVMKKGVIGDTFGGYEVAIDTFGEASAQVDSNITINENAAFRINAFYESLDNHRDYYDGDRFGVNPTLRYKLNERTSFDVSYELVDHERFIDRGIPTGADGKPVEAFEDLFFGDKDLNYTELEAHLFRATAQHKFSDELKGRLGFFYGNYDKAYSNFYASDYDPATDIVTLDGYVDTTQRENFIFSSDLVGEFETGSIGHTIITGIEFIQTSNDNDRFNPTFTNPTVSSDPSNPAAPLRTDVNTFVIGNQVLENGSGTNSLNQPTTGNLTTDLNDDTEADVSTFSFYLQDEIALLDNLNLVLGARFDAFKIDVTDLKNGAVKRDSNDSEISPRLGIIYKPKENISLYASYSETFLPRSGEQFANVSDKAASLDPDTFSNLEAGVKWDFESGLSLTASIFELKKSSPETARDDAAALDVIEATINGFEAQVKGHLTDKWHVSAGYSYLDGEVDGSGNRPRELPEHMFSLWNSYQLTDRLGLGLGFLYQGETYINNGNETELPSYFRVDAAAYYDLTDNLRLQLNVENLTDELYFPNAHSDHNVTVGAPINARIALVGRF
jgi:catecholate siderophore receptor